MVATPYSTRLALVQHHSVNGGPVDFLECKYLVPNDDVRHALVDDVNAVLSYRTISGPITDDKIARLFPPNRSSYDDELFNTMREILDEERDFIYTKHGLNVLINRYLFTNEPIQLGIARIAKNMTVERPWDFGITYHALSCGFVHVSSIIAAADHVDSDAINPGEACRLMVAKDNYDHQLISQIEKISELISLGVGVGYGVSNLPMKGKTERGKIRSGFMSLIDRLNACNKVFLHERKPKIALYLHVHNDTVNQALTIKMPNRVNKINNVFIGLMIPNHFMECVREDKQWYLFPGDLTLDGKNLADLTGDIYVRHFERCVSLGLYTRSCRARDLMYDIIQSLVESGSPYIIWSDHLNEYNNHKNYGTIKTLNLCAEITNYADSENDSSCTLLSCNMAMWMDFPDVFYMLQRSVVSVEYHDLNPGLQFEYPKQALYAYVIGYIGTKMLNGMIGTSRSRREIGLSPLGVYDMALMSNAEPDKICAAVSEAMYLGAVTASCREFEEYGTKCAFFDKSAFARGKPQFALRGIEPQADWTHVRERMRSGMANSMLTAQAPTATTSLLTGVTESVMIPISHYVSRESENGRNDVITYGLMHRLINTPNDDIPLNNNINAQLDMYKESLPYVDHSQSVMLSLDTNTNDIYRAIVATYRARMKTGVYYLVFKQSNPTINCGRMNGCDSCTL